MNLKSLIRTIPNYPKPGILFRDISTLLYNGNALKYITEIYYNRYKDKNLTGIAAIEARGFIFGAIVAEKLGIAFIPIRKKGKLPCKVYTEEYKLEYGTDSLEVDVTAINSSDNILIIDLLEVKHENILLGYILFPVLIFPIFIRKFLYPLYFYKNKS